MENVKLKPCPFCGSKFIQTIKIIGYSVKCFDCGAITGPYNKRENAVKAWNTRANTIPVGGGENYEVVHNGTT